MKTRLLIFSALMMTQTFALAADPVPTDKPGSEKREQVIEKREANQEKRIEEGVKNGSLTEKEAKHLEKKEEKVKKIEARAKEDGVVTQEEFKKIEKVQNRVSKKIANKKHNVK